MEGPLCPPADPGFRLIETCLWTPGTGVHRLALHLGRLRRSAARLGIAPRGVEEALEGVSGDTPLRLRLTVDRDGRPDVTTAPFTPLPEGTVWRISVARQRLNSADPWLGVKSTQRALYDRVRADLPEGADEAIFVNERDEICEGTITNVFAELGGGVVTPPLECGLLPGVLRHEMVQEGRARERLLGIDDLRRARSLWVGNALRGLIAARLV